MSFLVFASLLFQTRIYFFNGNSVRFCPANYLVWVGDV